MYIIMNIMSTSRSGNRLSFTRKSQPRCQAPRPGRKCNPRTAEMQAEKQRLSWLEPDATMHSLLLLLWPNMKARYILQIDARGVRSGS